MKIAIAQTDSIVGDIEGRGEEITLYRHGDFVDLCRGPHVPHTG